MRALLITNPNNPLGTVYSPATVRAMLTWCLRRRVHYVRCGRVAGRAAEAVWQAGGSRSRGQASGDRPAEGGRGSVLLGVCASWWWAWCVFSLSLLPEQSWPAGCPQVQFVLDSAPSCSDASLLPRPLRCPVLRSDEIYAKSIYKPAPFVSALTLAQELVGGDGSQGGAGAANGGTNNSSSGGAAAAAGPSNGHAQQAQQAQFSQRYVDTYVHLVYGLSKDWCASGLRVGLLYSRNEHLQQVGRRVEKKEKPVCCSEWVQGAERPAGGAEGGSEVGQGIRGGDPAAAELGYNIHVGWLCGGSRRGGM